MSEIIERCARAILAVRKAGEESHPQMVQMVPDEQDLMDQAMKEARAVIEAMRIPTDEMVDAADNDWGPQLKDNWREMIDAALED